MRIKNVAFLRSMKHAADYRNDGLIEIAFVGKSNVGKSSLMNMLANNKKLARVSRQPGKTRLINFFRVQMYPKMLEVEGDVAGIAPEYLEFVAHGGTAQLAEACCFVDLPGYGFARVSKAEKESWEGMMRGYFDTSPNLRALLILMDIRHSPTEEDKRMIEYADYYAIPYIVVATKADKIAKSKRKAAAESLRSYIPASRAYPIIPVSALDGFGKEQLLAAMEKYLTGGSA